MNSKRDGNTDFGAFVKFWLRSKRHFALITCSDATGGEKTQSRAPSETSMQPSRSMPRLSTKYSRHGPTILPSHAQSLVNCVAHLSSATGWRMDATGHPNWGGATTLTTFSHLRI